MKLSTALKTTVTIITVLLLPKLGSAQNEPSSCSKDQTICLSSTSWPSVVWSDFDPDEINHWLNIHTKLNVPIFCNEASSSEQPASSTREVQEDVLRLVRLESSCSGTTPYDYSFNGKLGPDGLPQGKGTLSTKNQPKQVHGTECLHLHGSVSHIQGNFVKGLPDGMCSVTLQDGTLIKATFTNGVIVGKVRQFDNVGVAQTVSRYENGRPHGPTWLFPPNFAEEGAVMAIFEEGKMRVQSVLHYRKDLLPFAIRGRLVNDTYLQDPVKVRITRMGSLNDCMKVIDTQPLEEPEAIRGPWRIPVKVLPRILGDSRIFLRTSKTLFFNRIAKTGSQGLIALLYKLEKANGFRVRLDMLKKEELLEPPVKVAQVALSLLKDTRPTVYIRHYNFVPFAQFGIDWTPDFFNVVRHPVERVISWFYYWRSAWNVVERKIQYPDEPLPDPEFLRKDFDTCVLQGDPECQFIPGSNVLGHSDHRSQMMAFCGHDPICTEFNSERVLQLAKSNVDKFYPVVGVLEHLNMTLAVLEHKLPQIFKGATKVYYEASEVKKYKNRNALKVPVAADVYSLVSANFTREIEFYEFCKQRLQAQFKDII